MKNNRLLSLLFAVFFVLVSSIFLINKADAVSLQYQVLQPNGQTSHADQYMDKPANVVIQNGKYYVSMTSTVPAWIGSHPVTYTSINNGDGQIVNNAHGASFKFSTTDLSKLIPVTMHLDVKVANINMDAMVYLKFLNVPALNSANSGSNDSQAASNNGSDGGNDSSGDSSDQPAADDTQADDGNNDQSAQKVTIKKPVKLDQAKKNPDKSKKANKGDGASVIYPDKQKKQNEKKPHYVAIASGTVVLVAAIVAAVYYHKKMS